MTDDLFTDQAARYDAWYDTREGRAAFSEEVDALRPLFHGLPRPWLEVGVGTGRPAAALGIEFGIDPALGALTLAARRGIRVAAGRAENLPFPDMTFGAVLLVLALCFVAEPLNALREAARVLAPGGGIVLGLLPAEGPWGQHYQRLAREGHQYYREAHFFTRRELGRLLGAAHLRPARTRSALSWAPGSPPEEGPARQGDLPAAGFTAMLVVPKRA